MWIFLEAVLLQKTRSSQKRVASELSCLSDSLGSIPRASRRGQGTPITCCRLLLEDLHLALPCEPPPKPSSPKFASGQAPTPASCVPASVKPSCPRRGHTADVLFAPHLCPSVRRVSQPVCGLCLLDVSGASPLVSYLGIGDLDHWKGLESLHAFGLSGMTATKLGIPQGFLSDVHLTESPGVVP